MEQVKDFLGRTIKEGDLVVLATPNRSFGKRRVVGFKMYKEKHCSPDLRVKLDTLSEKYSSIGYAAPHRLIVINDLVKEDGIPWLD